jgi:hypothetical protein
MSLDVYLKSIEKDDITLLTILVPSKNIIRETLYIIVIYRFTIFYLGLIH